MTRRVLPALLVLCSVSIGCTSTTTTKADADAPKPNTSAAKEDVGPESEPEPDPTKLARAPLPRAELPDCPTEPGDAIANYCTDDGKLAGQWVPVDTLKVPDDVEVIFNAEGPDTSKQTSLLIATRGEQLYIKQVTCGACRRVLGEGFSGHLSHMSEAQLRELQTQLGLGTDTPTLASADQWASFASEARGKEALTQLASKAEGEAAPSGRGR